MEEKILTQTFNTNPDTVFGILVTILVLILVFAGLFFKALANRIYEDFKSVREREREENNKKEEETNNRFRELHKLNYDLQERSIEILTKVVQANTLSNSELVSELRSHKNSSERLAEASFRAISNAEESSKSIQEQLSKINESIKAV